MSSGSDDTDVQDAVIDLVCTFLLRKGEDDAAQALCAAITPEEGVQVEEAQASATKKAVIKAELSRLLGRDVSTIARAPRPRREPIEDAQKVEQAEDQAEGTEEEIEEIEEIEAELAPKPQIEIVEIEDDDEAAAGETEIVQIVEEAKGGEPALEEVHHDSAMLSLD